MKRKEHDVKQYEETTKELLKDAPEGTSSPVLKELEKLKKSFSNVQTQLVDMKTVLDESLKDLLELHALLQELYKVMDDIDECINKSSDALDGDEHDLETCLNVSHLSKRSTSVFITSTPSADIATIYCHWSLLRMGNTFKLFEYQH